jgi:hypothetical protein
MRIVEAVYQPILEALCVHQLERESPFELIVIKTLTHFPADLPLLLTRLGNLDLFLHRAHPPLWGQRVGGLRLP